MKAVHLQAGDIAQLEKRYRTKLINGLSGFKSVNLLGTMNKEGQTNLSLVSSVVHIGANPPLMGFIMRPISVTRDSYNNIMATGYFTFNHLQEEFYKAAHQASARYPSTTSEFEAVGLQPKFSDLVKAPYVAESTIQIGLAFRDKMEISLNNTILIIGEIMELFVPEDCLGTDGFLNIEKAGSLTCSGLDSYHKTNKLGRLSYAKPDQPLREI